jgi:hypothetical protein
MMAPDTARSDNAIERPYQGQTTNFRKPGGGFAPVYTVPA